MSEKYIDGGYILLSRKLIESAIWEKPPMYLKVWIYILSKAQHKAYKNLDRGELLITIPELIEVCSHKVGYRTERPSKSQIFNILEWLRNSGEGADEDDASRNMIDTTKTTRGMVVKVHNYNVYQDPSNYERNAERNNEEVTTETMRQRQADTINKNGKNEKKEEKKENGETDYISKIRDLSSLFSSIFNFNSLSKNYWNVVRETRVTNNISESVIYRNMKSWSKYEIPVVEYALKEHIKNHKGKREEYTIGIMRKTTVEEAKLRLKGNGTAGAKDDKGEIFDKLRKEVGVNE